MYIYIFVHPVWTFLIIPFCSQEEEDGEGVCFGNGERSGRANGGGGDDFELPSMETMAAEETEDIEGEDGGWDSDD